MDGILQILKILCSLFILERGTDIDTVSMLSKISISKLQLELRRHTQEKVAHIIESHADTGQHSNRHHRVYLFTCAILHNMLIGHDKREDDHDNDDIAVDIADHSMNERISFEALQEVRH